MKVSLGGIGLLSCDILCCFVIHFSLTTEISRNSSAADTASMATSFHPSDIQYVSDNSIQLQSIKHNGYNQRYYNDAFQPDTYQNGNYGNGSSSSAVFAPPQPSTSLDHEVSVTEEEEEEAPVRLRTGPPKDFLLFSIGIMILFCSPIALTAVQSARQCRKAISVHNMAIADSKSEEAKGRAFLAILLGIATWVLIVTYVCLGVLDE